MGYDYISEHSEKVVVKDAYDTDMLAEFVAGVLKNTRHVLELHVVRDETYPNQWDVTYKNLEHGVTA